MAFLNHRETKYQCNLYHALTAQAARNYQPKYHRGRNLGVRELTEASDLPPLIENKICLSSRGPPKHWFPQYDCSLPLQKT